LTLTSAVGYNVSEANVGKRKIDPSSGGVMAVAGAVSRRFESGGVRPVVRLRPAPPVEPPYDDERAPEGRAVCAGQLELRPPGRPSRPAATRPPTPVALPNQVALANPAPPAAAVRAVGAVPSEAGIATLRFVKACVEVLNGFRPVTHLRAHTTPPDYVRVADQLTRRAVRLHMVPSRGHRPGVPARAPEPVVIQRLHVCEPRAGAVEAAVVLAHAGATWAMAVRLERRHRQQWHCTLMQVI
jgi:hypothetical protein